jgi:hypothetical protein
MHSIPVIPTRLRWDGKVTFLRHSGIEVVLPFRPPVVGEDVAEIDYAPTMGTKQIRESAHGWRDMVPAEFDTLHAWMSLFSQDVLGAANRLAGA